MGGFCSSGGLARGDGLLLLCYTVCAKAGGSWEPREVERREWRVDGW